jgi:hypothetical protein
MAVNTAVWEEGTEIIVDSEVEAPAPGWTLNYVHVRRSGGGVQLHIEATNNAAAAGLVATLQGDFAPGDVVTDPSGNFSLAANGQLTFLGSTAASAKHVCQLIYAAGETSP